MLRIKHNKKGFTLIEAIVVAIIILILASVAIPIYNGFVNDARQDAVDNLAETAAAAANTFVRKRGAANLTVENLNLHYNESKYSIELTGNNNITVSEIDGDKSTEVSYQ